MSLTIRISDRRITFNRIAIPHREAHLALSVPLPLHQIGQLALQFPF